MAEGTSEAAPNAAGGSPFPAGDGGLIRGLGLKEATAANVVEMVGIGPFITIPILLGFMGGPQALLGWLVGAVLAVSDGLVWAELGAAMPGAGGSYQYLREAYGHKRMGLMMSFLFVWMILFTAPLSAATGAVGFAEYLHYLLPNLSPMTTKLIAVGVVLGITVLLYRDIKTVGRLSFVFMLVVLGSILWVIFSGLFSIKLSLLLDFPPNAFSTLQCKLTLLGTSALCSAISRQSATVILAIIVRHNMVIVRKDGSFRSCGCRATSRRIRRNPTTR